MAIALPRDSFVRFNGSRLSDHNRSEVDQSFERIESRVRTARGRMRKSYVADKRSFTISWDALPEKDADTIDGRWGAKSLIDFYKSTPGAFTLELVDSDDNYSESYTVVFTDFSYSIVHRFDNYYYNLSLGLEEV